MEITGLMAQGAEGDRDMDLTKFIWTREPERYEIKQDVIEELV